MRKRVGEREIRVLRAKHRARARRHSVGGDDGAGARSFQRRGIFRVGKKGDVTRDGLLEAGHATDFDAAVSLEAARQLFRKHVQFHWASSCLITLPAKLHSTSDWSWKLVAGSS
jgi:hypothetical protein